MKIEELQTPAILVDLDSMEANLKKYCDAAKKNGKQVWPMLKTHKSLEFTKAQKDAGCTGWLCGTLDEAEAIAEAGYDNIMYAYPVATDVSFKRVLKLAKKCNFITRIDGLDAAKLLNDAAAKEGVKVNYVITVDCGLHRFGVKPDKVVDFANSLKGLSNLVFKGISTHSGQVYGAKSKAEVPNSAKEEHEAIKLAVESLKSAGYNLEIISTGSTPTYFLNIADPYVNIYHPGNYIFNDCIQLSTETATEAECSLRIWASVISHPAEDLFICDAGAKCLGLDQGAHGNTSIVGYGRVVGHPELTVAGLSEEVGKFHVNGSTTLKVGDKVQIIPNHSCSSANLTSYYVGVRKGEVDHLIKLDMRGNSTTKGV